MSATDLATQRERELKFDVPDEWTQPDLRRLAPPGGRVGHEDVTLESTYYDTARRDLLRAGLTLRRRTDSREQAGAVNGVVAGESPSDAGWQLKIPDGNARIELRLPPDGRAVPAEMRRVLQGVRGGAALAPIAIVRVERGLHRVHDAEGRPLAEIAVDEVHATELGEFAVGRHWREVEVELLDGDEALLERCARRLGKSGAHPAASPSKLRRALGDPGADATPEGVAELLQGYLDTQYAVILAGDLALRQGPAAVHGIRTAVRRYRSVLRELEPVLDAERAVHLEGELRWWALALGEVRDREVLRSHLAAAVAQLPGELVLGPVAARIEETVSTEERDARAALDRLMRTKRYFALLAELAAWHEQVPADERVPADVVARYVAKATHRTRRRLKRARRGQGTPEHDAQLHSARKAAKRARYLAELARPELGKKAHKAGRKMKRVQRRLGRHQDHVIAAQFLRRVGAVAGTAPNENGFTFGLLFESESAAARIAR